MSNDWYQQALTPPEVVEVRIKIGWIPSADHAQAWWEVVDPMTSVVQGAGAIPHRPAVRLPELIEETVRKAVAAAERAHSPF